MLPENIETEDAIKILKKYAEVYEEDATQTEWFERIKSICEYVGYCADTKEYRKNPQNYKGSVGMLSTVIRIAITSRQNTPDLYSIMKLLGKEKCLERINDAVESFKEQLK